MLAEARFRDARPMGEGKHVRFTVESPGARAQAVAFGTGGVLPVAEGALAEATFKLEVNEWNGVCEPRLVLRQRGCGAAADRGPRAAGGRAAARRLRAASAGLACDRRRAASIRWGRPLPLWVWRLSTIRAVSATPTWPSRRVRRRCLRRRRSQARPTPPPEMRRPSSSSAPGERAAAAAGPLRARAAAARRSVRDRLRARCRLGGRDRPSDAYRTRSCSPASTTRRSGASRARTSSSIRSASRGSARACDSTPRRCARRCCTTPSRTPRRRSRRCARASARRSRRSSTA